MEEQYMDFYSVWPTTVTAFIKHGSVVESTNKTEPQSEAALIVS